MKTQTGILLAVLVTTLGFAPTTEAAKGNWKKGRIYYQMVCTACHADEAGRKISPAEMTRAEWAAYFQQDVHHPEDDKPASYYVSSEFRQSVQDSNRAAKKMLKVSDAQLLADVMAFTEHGAKDSDQPATCK